MYPQLLGNVHLYIPWVTQTQHVQDWSQHHPSCSIILYLLLNTPSLMWRVWINGTTIHPTVQVRHLAQVTYHNLTIKITLIVTSKLLRKLQLTDSPLVPWAAGKFFIPRILYILFPLPGTLLFQPPSLTKLTPASPLVPAKVRLLREAIPIPATLSRTIFMALSQPCSYHIAMLVEFPSSPIRLQTKEDRDQTRQ